MQNTRNGRVGRAGRERIARREQNRIRQEHIELIQHWIHLGWAPMNVETYVERVCRQEHAQFELAMEQIRQSRGIVAGVENDEGDG